MPATYQPHAWHLSSSYVPSTEPSQLPLRCQLRATHVPAACLAPIAPRDDSMAFRLAARTTLKGLTGETAMAGRKIDHDHIVQAYDRARDAFEGKLSETQAVAALMQAGMTKASASDYVRNLRQMLVGKAYHRTLSDAGTRYYLAKILSDFGPIPAEAALRALRGHIVYYEAISGSRRPSLRAIASAFERELAEFAVVDPYALLQAELRALDGLPEDRRRSARRRYAVQPPRRVVSVVVYERNPYVVREVLARAAGVCEQCGADAPFLRSTDGQPYLEVHHQVRLADGGEDTVENAIAACPNCHRRAHYG